MKKESKTIHEAFSRFFEEPTRENLRSLLKEHVGELRNCDFKESWPDHPSLAKHILGLGNSGGGCLVVGVKENPDKTTEFVGLDAITDKVDITNGIRGYIPTSLLNTIEIADFKYEASEYPKLVGKIFQVIFVHFKADEIPFVAVRAGSGIRSAAIYIRREGATEEATYDELQRVISERISAAGISQQARDLKEHLDELKMLYEQIPRNLASTLPIFQSLSNQWSGFFGKPTPNPSYPSEDYEAFVKRMLDAKKGLIEKILGVSKSA